MTQLYTRTGEAFKGKALVNDKGQIGFYTRRKCGRCGGAGGSDRWAFTGWTCFDCSGKGHKGEYDFNRLYDADKLAQLNERQAKADATRARKAAERAAAEAARVEAERADIIAAHADIVARIAANVDVEGEGFLADMRRQVVERARPLSDRQLELANAACAKIEAERARKATARHVGVVGEKVELELTYVRKFDISEQWYGAPARFIWTFRAACGSTVTYFGGYPKALDDIQNPGDTVRLTATVKAHEEYRGEPQTVIMRPTPLKVAA